MLAIFQKAFAHPPEELNSPASHFSGKTPKLPGDTLSDFLSLHKDTAFSMNFGDSAVVLWDRRSVLYVSWEVKQSLHVEPTVRAHGEEHERGHLEAYRTLRDRGPYPADQVLRGLEGSYAFVVYDTQTSSVFSALSSDGGESLYWGISEDDGSVLMSDDVKIIKQGCAKSFAPFPTGCMFHSETGLKSFEHPKNKMKAMQRIDSEGVICGANFKVDACSKVNAIPRRGSEANWALANSS
ncbi:aluminum induced protein with YGL and LRDR motifs [Raphanus sativus]|nr:aluminum induced protein with YGL and LRDR motifs [Raphanus sativus]